jgi:hypothetical protein
MDMVDYECLDLIHFEKIVHEKAPLVFQRKKGNAAHEAVQANCKNKLAYKLLEP